MNRDDRRVDFVEVALGAPVADGGDETHALKDGVRQRLERIAERSDKGTTVTDVVDKYGTQRDFGVPIDESIRTVARAFNAESVSGPTDENIATDGDGTTLTDLEPGEWCAVEVVVVSAWEPTTDAVRQEAHISAGEDLIRAVSWEKSDLERLDIGGSYRIEQVVATEDDRDDEDRIYLSMNSQTNIIALEGEDRVDAPEDLPLPGEEDGDDE